MNEKRFIQSWNMHRGLYYLAIEDTQEKKIYCVEQYIADVEKVVCLLNEQQSTIDEQKIAIDELINDYKKLEKKNEQLRTQLLICQQSKNDDGRIQVWEVPPISKGMRITTFTTSDGDI